MWKQSRLIRSPIRLIFYVNENLLGAQSDCNLAVLKKNLKERKHLSEIGKLSESKIYSQSGMLWKHDLAGWKVDIGNK